MKKNLMITAFLALACIFCLNTARAQEVPINYNQLPEKAQVFITTHFPNAMLVKAKMDQNNATHVYDVTLNDGTEIEFDRSGEWLEVDCNKNTVPPAIVPEAITQNINNAYPGTHIQKIKRLKGWIEVDLSNDIEVTFDKNMNVIEVD